VFEGTFVTGLDDPALIIGLSSETNTSARCADLTSSFASQLNPIQTFWGKETQPVNRANLLRNEIAKIKPEVAGERVTDFINVASDARKPIFLLGDSDPGPLLAFPGQSTTRKDNLAQGFMPLNQGHAKYLSLLRLVETRFTLSCDDW
jgi:hypothetical protein